MWALRGRIAAARVSRHVLVVLPDLAHDVEEGVVDVDAALGRRLDELAAERARELLALCGATNVSAYRTFTYP